MVQTAGALKSARRSDEIGLERRLQATALRGARSVRRLAQSPVAGAVLLPMPITPVLVGPLTTPEPPAAAERKPSSGLVVTLYRQSDGGPLYAIALHRRPARETR
jgi:hypothetical protein